MDEDKTLWAKEIDQAEQGYPTDSFYEDVRYLTTIVSELCHIIDQQAPGSIEEDLDKSINWYFASTTAGSNALQPQSNPQKCRCDATILLHQGCQCGGN